jgi:hypothetical protein
MSDLVQQENFPSAVEISISQALNRLVHREKAPKYSGG